MTPSQMTFTKEGLGAFDTGLTREDQVLKAQMKARKVLCPYCLYYGTLWEFHTRLKNKRGKHFVSISKCKCPYCNQRYMKETLLKVARMSMEEFGEWFWSQMFDGWGFGDHVDFPILKKRLKDHYDYETRQVFWDVYWKYKNERDDGTTAEDREAFEDYKRSYEGKQ